MAIQEFIKIRGARVHNLKNVNLDIPKNKLVVITGLSGSGKSSLAFDTLYAEAERRFVESLSSYARQFLGVSDKPDIDSIDGLSPAISIDQKSVSKNPRSTVGTITEIYDYMRILFARIGKPHCSECGKSIGRQSVDQITDQIFGNKGKEILILGPLASGKKGEHHGLLEEVKKAGFLRVRVNGILYRLEDALLMQLDKKKKHSIEVVVDRFIMNPVRGRSPLGGRSRAFGGATTSNGVNNDIEHSRIADSVEIALKIGKGLLIVADANDKKRDRIFSEKFACTDCGISIPEIEPRLFSFNSPYGACSNCTGLGAMLEVVPELALPNKNLTLAEGAIRPWANASHRVGRQSWYWWLLEDLAERFHFSLSTPVKNLPAKALDVILYGEGGGEGKESLEGVIPNLKRR